MSREAMAQAVERLAAGGTDDAALDDKLTTMRQLRALSPQAAEDLDRELIVTLSRLREGLDELVARQREVRELLDALSRPPLHLAAVLATHGEGPGATALVALPGGGRRVVALAPEVAGERLVCGDPVLLGPERNLIAARSPYGWQGGGETALFERRTADGRLVLRRRDEEVLVDPSPTLAAAPLRRGDRVRLDRDLWLAVERLDAPGDESLRLESTPTETFADVGGLDRQIAALQRAIRLHLEHAAVARRYGLRRPGGVLLSGPPGTGKTLLARALANWLARVSPAGRARFLAVKPGGLHSMWYSQSEANYREVFRLAREAGRSEPTVPVVLFFDEVDGVGASRGTSLHRVDDRVLEAFLAELDGFDRRGNVLVVGATNRLAALDPALLRPGRLGDLVLEIPRPGMDAARAVLACHLSLAIPYAADGAARAAEARDEALGAAVGALFAPTAPPLATLTLRDGRRVDVLPRHLVSGALLARVAQTAVERACAREVETGAAGVRPADLLTALDEVLDAAARVLQPGNCRRHLDHLPQDVDVVAVTRPTVRTRRAYRYLRVA